MEYYPYILRQKLISEDANFEDSTYLLLKQIVNLPFIGDGDKTNLISNYTLKKYTFLDEALQRGEISDYNCRTHKSSISTLCSEFLNAEASIKATPFFSSDIINEELGIVLPRNYSPPSLSNNIITVTIQNN